MLHEADLSGLRTDEEGQAKHRSTLAAAAERVRRVGAGVPVKVGVSGGQRDAGGFDARIARQGHVGLDAREIRFVDF